MHFLLIVEQITIALFAILVLANSVNTIGIKNVFPVAICAILSTAVVALLTVILLNQFGLSIASVRKERLTVSFCVVALLFVALLTHRKSAGQ